MNWPIWLFVIVLVGLLVGWLMTRSVLFVPLTALVVYLAVDFSVLEEDHELLWDITRTVFWIGLILAVIAFVIARFGLLFVVGAFALAAVLGASLVAWAISDDDEVETSSSDDGTTATTMPSEEEDVRDCPDTWKVVHIDHEDSNRWFADGVQEINEADTPQEARDAARTWLSLVRRDPNLLKGAAAYFTDSQVSASDLVDGECASEEAEALTAEIELAIADATVTPDEAPADGTNSGTDADGNVTASPEPGITGDRTAIKIESKDGDTVWIMARCGNPVVQGPAPVPPGPTDNPPTTTTTQPPTTVTTLTPKDPSQDVNVNPDVPEQVRGPGTTPIGQDPGPATEPVDSPTGCNGPCPGSATTTTRPPSSGGSTTTVPSCGQAGQPSCNNTGVTPPTTEAPPPAPPDTSSPDDTVVSP